MECVSEFPLANLSDFIVNTPLQGIQIWEDFPPHVLLHSGKQEEVRGGQIRGISGVGQELGVCLLEKAQDVIMPVHWGPIMVQPEILSPPKLWSFPSDMLSESLHHSQIKFSINSPSVGHKFMHDDSFGIPKSDQHHLVDVSIFHTFGWAWLVFGQPGACAHVGFWLVTGEPGFIPCHNSVLQCWSTQKSPLGFPGKAQSVCLLVVIQQMGDPLCGPLLELQFVPEDVMNCPQR